MQRLAVSSDEGLSGQVDDMSETAVPHMSGGDHEISKQNVLNFSLSPFVWLPHGNIYTCRHLLKHRWVV